MNKPLIPLAATLLLLLSTALISRSFAESSDTLAIQKSSLANAASSAVASSVISTSVLPISETAKLSSTDLWQRLRGEFQLIHQYRDQFYRKRINEEIQWLKKHPAYLKRVSRRAEPYLHYVVNQMVANGLPGELALLPIVESAYDPFAYSPGRAAGLWQFIPATGKHFELQQDWWQDERRDVVESTRAAIDYLSSVHRRFDNDWLLALASYNAGQGRISKLRRHNAKANKPQDYWSLALPNETKRYVPRLLAIAEVINNPDKYGISLHAIEDAPQFVSIGIGSQLDLAQAAALADISMDVLYKYNPQYNRWATPPEGPHRLLMPIDNAEIFTSALMTLTPEQRLSWKRYKIKSGDTLSEIVSQFGTTSKQVRLANGLKNDSIRIGKILMIPVASEANQHYVMSAEQRNQRLLVSGSKSNRQPSYYVVKEGDSWWTISRQFSVSTSQLTKWNGKAPGDMIRPGQKLVVWDKKKSISKTNQLTGFSREPVFRKVYYQVRSGDNLSTIANRFKVKLHDLIAWNKLDNQRYLKPGQQLSIHVDVTRG